MEKSAPKQAKPQAPAAMPSVPRRGFLVRAGAAVIGAVVGIFPLLTGLVVFLDPLRRKSGLGQPIRIATTSAVPDDGVPRQFPVIADREDAWNRYASERIGSVYLVRQPGQSDVQAFNASCPHAGCMVAYLADKKYFQCPCHTSAFDTHGHRKLDVSKTPPRDMDSLECELRGNEIWVRFENFQTGIERKIARA